MKSYYIVITTIEPIKVEANGKEEAQQLAMRAGYKPSVILDVMEYPDIKLIAAAPDLLEAVIAGLKQLKEYTQSAGIMVENEDRAALVLMEKAISKATGQ